MHNTNRMNRYFPEPNGGTVMHPGDSPEAYEKLAPPEQAALLEWIRLAIKPAKTTGPGTSYGIKHDFEKVGFYITNGQFKGAMLAAGYAPVDPNELNWQFRIRPTGKRRESKNGTVYHVEHLAPEELKSLATLIEMGERAQARRYDAYRKRKQSNPVT